MTLRLEALRWTISSTGLPPGKGTALSADSSITCRLAPFPYENQRNLKGLYHGDPVRSSARGRHGRSGGVIRTFHFRRPPVLNFFATVIKTWGSILPCLVGGDQRMGKRGLDAFRY